MFTCISFEITKPVNAILKRKAHRLLHLRTIKAPFGYQDRILFCDFDIRNKINHISNYCATLIKQLAPGNTIVFTVDFTCDFEACNSLTPWAFCVPPNFTSSVTGLVTPRMVKSPDNLYVPFPVFFIDLLLNVIFG